MKPFRHPLVFLVGANVLLWGLAFSADRIQAFLARFAGPGLTLPAVANRPSVIPAQPSGLASASTAANSSSLTKDPFLDDLSSLDRDLPLKSAQVQSAQRQFPSQTTLRQSPATGLKDVSDVVPSHTDHFLARLAKADGLGGEVSLKSSSDPLMPIAAKVERLQHQRSNDVLSALPLHWREPLRQELAKRPAVSKVATVRIPVADLSQRYEVPVIIDETGQAEGLSQPGDHKAQVAVENWMARQKPSESGTVSVMVVSAEPMISGAIDSGSLTASKTNSSSQLPMQSTAESRQPDGSDLSNIPF